MNYPNLKYEISVIIPTYNRSQLLSFTCESLLRQNMSKENFEVIICDDGSTDDTKEVAAKYHALMNLKYVYQEDKGYRPGSARNMGIRVAEGRICLFIDSSVMLHSDCLLEHVRFHSQQVHRVSAIGYVYGFDHNEESEDLLKRLVTTDDITASIKRLATYSVFHDVREDHYVRYNDNIHELPAPWYYFWTCHLSIAAKDLQEVGLFDECYDGRWGVEDNDLGFRLCLHGVKIHLLRSAQSIHYPHGKNKAERQLEGYENCKLFHEKFNTLETNLFLNAYTKMGESLVDINQMSLDTSSARTNTANFAAQISA